MSDEHDEPPTCDLDWCYEKVAFIRTTANLAGAEVKREHLCLEHSGLVDKSPVAGCWFALLALLAAAGCGVSLWVLVNYFDVVLKR